MSGPIAEQISLFRAQLQNRRLGGETLQILEAILVAKDIRSLLEIRSALRGLLRSELVSVVGEIAGKSTDQKLRDVEFFVRAFALIGDVESCLALKYEALVLRETKHNSNCDLKVSYEEWFTFAKESLDNGYYTIAVKGFESALSCIQSNNNLDPDHNTFLVGEHIISNIKELRDTSAAIVASHSECFSSTTGNECSKT